MINGKWTMDDGVEDLMAKGDDIEDRLIRFAVSVMDLAESLPTTFAGQHIGNQLLRAGTSPAPKYTEARGCESMRDFIHKLGIVLKELNESRVWLRMVCLKPMVPSERCEPVFKECDELCRIIAVSRRTAERNSRGGRIKNQEFLILDSNARQRRAFVRGRWGAGRTTHDA